MTEFRDALLKTAGCHSEVFHVGEYLRSKMICARLQITPNVKNDLKAAKESYRQQLDAVVSAIDSVCMILIFIVQVLNPLVCSPVCWMEWRGNRATELYTGGHMGTHTH